MRDFLAGLSYVDGVLALFNAACRAHAGMAVSRCDEYSDACTRMGIQEAATRAYHHVAGQHPRRSHGGRGCWRPLGAATAVLATYLIASPARGQDAPLPRCTEQPGTMVHQQNWANGVAPRAMPNMRPFYYQSTVWSGTDPADPVYPEIASSEAVTVFTNRGPQGENVLDFNPFAAAGGDTYVTAGVALGGFGSIPPRTSGEGNWWDATKGCISVAYQWTTAAWNQAVYNPLVTLSSHIYGWQFEFSADLANSTRGTFRLQYPVFDPTLPSGSPVKWLDVDTPVHASGDGEPVAGVRHPVEERHHRRRGDPREGRRLPARVLEREAHLRRREHSALSERRRQDGAGQAQPVESGWATSVLFGPVTNLEVVDTRDVPDDDSGGRPPPPPAFGTIHYYHTDAIGSVRMVTGPTGQVEARHDFLPFGYEWQPPATPEVRLFTGKERDPETGLDYFGARYFAQNLGRFLRVRA